MEAALESNKLFPLARFPPTLFQPYSPTRNTWNMWNCGLRIRAALSLTHRCQSGNQGGLGRRATSSRKYFTLSNLEPLRTSWVCNCLQCLQSSRSQVGGSNLDSCVEETFQKTLNLWTGRSQLPPETFKSELRPLWWATGTEGHSPPPSPSCLERY